MAERGRSAMLWRVQASRIWLCHGVIQAPPNSSVSSRAGERAREAAPADAVACFEHGDGEAAPRQRFRRRSAREAGADDEDVGLHLVRHLLHRHPGLEPGSILELLQRRTNGSRLKAGMTKERWHGCAFAHKYHSCSRGEIALANLASSAALASA